MRRLTWTILALVGCFGCGDDKKDSGASVDTGLDDSKTLNTLTQEEFQKFCTGLGSADQKSVSKADGCKMAGYMAGVMAGALTPTDADMQKACTDSYDACMKAEPQTSQKQCTQDATCTATVGEAEACYEAGLKAAADMMKDIPSCSSITAKSLQQNTGTGGTSAAPAEPPECTTLKSKCSNWATVAAIPTGG